MAHRAVEQCAPVLAFGAAIQMTNSGTERRGSRYHVSADDREACRHDDVPEMSVARWTVRLMPFASSRWLSRW
jgi:hypothetical protein